MGQVKEFHAQTNGGRMVRVIEERPNQEYSRGVRHRSRYLLEGRQPLTQLNDGYLALPGSGLVLKLVAPVEFPWHQWTWHISAD
jgi:hypothetical protein